MRAWDLRAARNAQRLTLRQVAVAAGTSVPDVSAYERGTKTPNAATTSRLSAVVQAGHASPIHRHDLVTVPRCAAALRRAMRQPAPTTSDLLRIVREMISNADEAWDSSRDRAAFFAPPTTTGDMRWDAMLADELRLPAGWLNDGAKGFMPGPDRAEVRVGLDTTGISVQVASPECMFAMKAAATGERPGVGWWQ